MKNILKKLVFSLILVCAIGAFFACSNSSGGGSSSGGKISYDVLSYQLRTEMTNVDADKLSWWTNQCGITSSDYEIDEDALTLHLLSAEANSKVLDYLKNFSPIYTEYAEWFK